MKIDASITSHLCNPANGMQPCCSKDGQCGIGHAFCSCPDCVDSRVVLLKMQMASQCSDSLSNPLPTPARTMADTGRVVQDLDVVYNWVNFTSLAFQAQYQKGVDDHGEKHGVNWHSTSTRDDTAMRHSIRSLVKSGVWPRVRKVYIVFNPVHGPPTFLNASHPQLVLVPQDDVLLPQGGTIPNFNSNALQLSIANLPGVLPWVLYLEDDTHVLKLDVGGADGGGDSGCPTLAEMHDNAYYIFTLYDRGLTAHDAPNKEKWDPWWIYQNNSNTLIDSIFGPTAPAGVRGAEIHAPHVLNMCVLKFMTHSWPAVERAVVANLKRPLRDVAGDQDFMFLYPQFIAAAGMATQKSTTLNVQGSKHAELHLPSFAGWRSRSAPFHEHLKRDAARKISAVVEYPASPCWFNFQSYDKVEGDPVYSAVKDFFNKHLGADVVSPLELTVTAAVPEAATAAAAAGSPNDVGTAAGQTSLLTAGSEQQQEQGQEQQQDEEGSFRLRQQQAAQHIRQQHQLQQQQQQQQQQQPPSLLQETSGPARQPRQCKRV